MNAHTTHTAAGAGPHHLMLGTMTVSTLLAGDETAGELSLVEVRGLPGSGPGPHLDPWRESFYVLEGKLTFRFEEGSEVRTLVAGPGDAVSIPAGIGHAFSVSSDETARFLVQSTPSGIDAFFADAGQPIESAEFPDDPPALDRARLLDAFANHGLTDVRPELWAPAPPRTQRPDPTR